MPNYFHLRDNMRIRHRWSLRAPRDEIGREVDPWQFCEGKRIESPGTIRFPVRPDGIELDFSLDSFANPVVHERVVDLFEHQRIRDVQFIPAEVEGHPGPYFILNALRTIRCIDDTRSRDVQYFTAEDGQPERVGQYRVVSGMKIDPTQVGDAHIFRPWGWNVALIVSEALMDAMEAVGITGTKFEPV